MEPRLLSVFKQNKMQCLWYNLLKIIHNYSNKTEKEQGFLTCVLNSAVQAPQNQNLCCSLKFPWWKMSSSWEAPHCAHFSCNSPCGAVLPFCFSLESFKAKPVNCCPSVREGGAGRGSEEPRKVFTATRSSTSRNLMNVLMHTFVRAYIHAHPATVSLEKKKAFKKVYTLLHSLPLTDNKTFPGRSSYFHLITSLEFVELPLFTSSPPEFSFQLGF